MATIINGKEVSAKIRGELAQETAALREKGIVPGLAVIIVGDDPASRVYVNNKKKACAEIGYYSEELALPADTTQEELLAHIAELSKRSDINGILCQLPLPNGLDEHAVIAAIPPEKDVDAFHVQNTGHIMVGDYSFLPCTPAGVIALLDAYDIPIEGKNCVVIGRSNIVGKPMAMLLLHRNGTVTMCHSRTKDLAEFTRRADIIICSVGKAGFLTGDMVSDGAVVIDVGINRNAEGKLCGDVDYASVEPKCSAITPVPGGVGPMTIAMLMRNTLTAAKEQNGIK